VRKNSIRTNWKLSKSWRPNE